VGQRSEPDPFADGFTGPIAGRALSAAVTLGVFEALSGADASPAELAQRLGLDPLGAEVLATALLALGYLELADGRLRNSPVTERLLVGSSAESIATFIGAQGELHWDVLTMLPEALRDGRAYAMHEERRDPEQWRAYMRGLFEVSRAEQDDNAALVPVGEPRSLVDVAGGHGAFAMAMCRRHPSLRATVLDLPASAAVGRRIVAEEGLAERIEFREGDALTAQLGEGLDVVSAFNFLHHLPPDEARGLVARARAALRPGGCLVVGETERTPPGAPATVNGALSGLVYFASSGTRNYTADEVRGWLREAGFASVDVHRNQRSPWRLLYVART
jgi:ubiquinone/menaquinone biosynthesis C-methylase UbiE